jgi:hypothetical protein
MNLIKQMVTLKDLVSWIFQLLTNIILRIGVVLKNFLKCH